MNIKKYKVIITPTAYREINNIYDYIANELYAESAAKNLMRKIEKEILNLQYEPRLHIEIEKTDELKRTYRKIVIKNYIVLYTIDSQNNIVFISHIYYNKRNYLNSL